jgi:hypothetical protein
VDIRNATIKQKAPDDAGASSFRSIRIKSAKAESEVQPFATTGALPIGALPAQPAALNRARMAVVAIRNFFIEAPRKIE